MTTATPLFAHIYEEAAENERQAVASLKKLTPAQVREVACVLSHVAQSGIGQNISRKLFTGINACGVDVSPFSHDWIKRVGKRITPTDYLKERMAKQPFITDESIFYLNPFGFSNCRVEGKVLSCDTGASEK